MRRSFAHHVLSAKALASLGGVAFFRRDALCASETASTSRNIRTSHDCLDVRDLRSDFSAISHEADRPCSTKRAHCEARKIEPSALLSARLFPNGATRDYISQSLLLNNAPPNFYFQCTTAYDILRQCGVELGKRNFMGTPVSP
jgi:hypothetical protein